jgi:hypothetical protein
MREKSEKTLGSQCEALTAAMTRIEIAPEVLDNFERFFDYIAQF